MKIIIALTAVAVLSACSLDAAQKQALADAAIVQIQSLNASGIDPINLDAEELALLSAGCAFVPAFYPDAATDIENACAAIMEAAK